MLNLKKLIAIIEMSNIESQRPSALDPEMRAFMLSFADKHLDDYLSYLEEELSNGQSTMATKIIMNIVYQLQGKVNPAADYLREELILDLLAYTQLLMLKWTARRPQDFPELYKSGITAEQVQSLFE